MKYLLPLLAVLVFPLGQVAAQPDLQRSHIEVNLPPQEVFESYLRRDLLGYFNRAATQTATAVESRPLRNGPTQSGTSYPKFYIWVKVYAGTTVQNEGAVRVAAVERTHFDVTDFLSKSNIQANPSEVGGIFPAALVPAILELAGAPQR
ncbi:hypothetical protein PFX98_00780 [Paucibacter sediminis]|uniref:Uncharacterized protein n=1 Tax=Paucibacter sediminis TaxID=3019553 RepID=A0AA95SPC0_9BURK|nr:hypothetical protein [Paucibacter sp. S2-9]WIT12170.1 hypothetical protein PFX98_00780 [Paucibacter sp. S2-9]